MQIGKLDTERRYIPTKVAQYGIVAYGDMRNDYPQRVAEIVSASVTGSACNKVYTAFLQGGGLADNVRINDQDINELVSAIARDLATFGGFACAVNYNANIEVTSVYPIPFDSVRLSVDADGVVCGVKLHPDWGRRHTNVRHWSAEDIVALPFFNPDNVRDEVSACGGWNNYHGQVYYYSNRGSRCYPLPIYDAALTDMSTEAAVADITNRNARNGFLPSGLLVDVSTDPDHDPQEMDEFIRKLQGSKNAQKIAYVRVRNEEEVPRLVPFVGANYDKEYSVSREAVKDAIGRAFNQPPILRNENVGSGFGSELIMEAYCLYNATTTAERQAIETALANIYGKEFAIIPLAYGDEVADKAGVIAVATNEEISKEQRLAILTTIYHLTDAEARKILIMED